MAFYAPPNGAITEESAGIGSLGIGAVVTKAAIASIAASHASLREVAAGAAKSSAALSRAIIAHRIRASGFPVAARLVGLRVGAHVLAIGPFAASARAPRVARALILSDLDLIASPPARLVVSLGLRRFIRLAACSLPGAVARTCLAVSLLGFIRVQGIRRIGPPVFPSFRFDAISSPASVQTRVASISRQGSR